MLPVAVTDPSCRLSVLVVEQTSPRRALVEQFIRDCYRREFGAELYHFLPRLLVVQEGDDIVAAAGFGGAAGRALFLEQYLDEPIEQVLLHQAQIALARGAIVEVGNLAAVGAGGARLLIAAMTRHLHHCGFTYVVFTGTRSLRNAFRRLGMLPLAIAPADPSRLGSEAQHWGRYYQEQPQVMAGPIAVGYRQLEKQP